MDTETIDVQCKCGRMIRLIKPKNPPPLNHWYWNCSQCNYINRQNNPIDYDKLRKELEEKEEG